VFEHNLRTRTVSLISFIVPAWNEEEHLAATLTPNCPENHGRAVMRLADSNSGACRPGAFGSEPHLRAETPPIEGG
jgi:hypothetical protein